MDSAIVPIVYASALDGHALSDVYPRGGEGSSTLERVASSHPIMPRYNSVFLVRSDVMK